MPDASEIGLVSDDVFVIVALPHRLSGRRAKIVDAFRGGGFERTNDGAQGAGWWPDGGA